MHEQLEHLSKQLPAEARYCVVVHYAEVGLKGQNRHRFEEQLRQNILRALTGTSIQSVSRLFGRQLIDLPNEFDWPLLKSRLEKVFGIAYFSLAVLTEQEMEAVTNAALALMSGGEYSSFRVTTKRSQKQFPLNSPEISSRVGAAIQKQSGAAVDLKNPEKTCFIEIFNRSALLYSDKITGPGGLPVGVSEKAVSLLSSGIDSPLASWKVMKRGVKIIFVHFHSVPATTPASIKNASRLVALLTRFQYKTKLYVVPFLEVQQQIMVGSPPPLRVILYRRSMFRMGEMIARGEGASALISGENVGQVASQTLSNIGAVADGVRLPVLRPLAGEDKKDIIDMAHRLGTFEISTEPYQDCCSLYVPKHPETRANLQQVRDVESALNLDDLHRRAVENAEIQNFKFPEAASEKQPSNKNHKE